MRQRHGYRPRLTNGYRKASISRLSKTNTCAGFQPASNGAGLVTIVGLCRDVINGDGCDFIGDVVNYAG